MRTLELVRSFHSAFGHPIAVTPDVSNTKTNALRVELIAEELSELKTALAARDAVSTLDALADLQYVLDGAWIAFGFAGAKLEAVEEVHRSNMSKLGPDGKPIYRADGKILKGPNYRPPNFSEALRIANQCRCSLCVITREGNS